MNDLQHHYRLLLGLDQDSVDLSLEQKRVEIQLAFVGKKVICPDCQAACSCADHAPERTSRHLDTMQFETILKARTPRSICTKCGVKTATVPWAGKSSRFTLMFEALAIEVLQACSNVKRAAALLKLSWTSVNRIMQRAVERGLARRSFMACNCAKCCCGPQANRTIRILHCDFQFVTRRIFRTCHSSSCDIATRKSGGSQLLRCHRTA